MYKLTGHVFYREATFETFKNPHIKVSPPYRADAACPSLKIMVEYNGKYHYNREDWQRTRNDVLKRRWCKLNGYLQIVVPALVSKNQLEKYLTFRLLTDTNVPVVGWHEDKSTREEFSREETVLIEKILNVKLPTLFEGPGQDISSIVVKNEGTIMASLKYKICKDAIRDPSTNRILHTYDGQSDFDVAILRFWKNNPKKNVNTSREIHIPFFLIGNRNKENILAKYISYRLIDTIDQATVFWKKDVYQGQRNAAFGYFETNY